MSRKQIVLGAAVAALSSLQPLAVAGQEPSTLGTEGLGSVHFPTSCRPGAQRSVDRAVALLHSFEFGPAIAGFRTALAADSGCAMGHWGIALSLWGNPFAPGTKPRAVLEKGRAAIAAAEAAGPVTEREREYIAAAARLYSGFEKTTQENRVAAFSEAMSALAARYPRDGEASIFRALALAVSADPADKTYARQIEAGAILERAFRRQPRHPGIAHYIIHAYDAPPLASRGLSAARAYARIAPGSPHALHMPSHIFTRLGLWEESIPTNVAAVAASRREGNVTEELHASDYLVYAYLQSGRDAAAARIVREVPAMASRLDPDALPVGAAPVSAAYFAMAAIPARYALERGDWRAASGLPVRATRYAFTDAITWYARGMGAARLGEAGAGTDAARELSAIRERLTEAGEPYWARQVEIQRLDVLAWATLAGGDRAGGLALMRKAVDLENSTEKSAVTPGPIAPARELLGDMLLQLGRAADALAEFEATLGREPNRFRSLYGAAVAAAGAGNAATARRHAAALLAVCANADQPGRSALAAARALAPVVPDRR